MPAFMHPRKAFVFFLRGRASVLGVASDAITTVRCNSAKESLEARISADNHQTRLRGVMK